MRVLITGGLGFVGTNLIETLNEHGHNDVVVYDNESLGQPEHIEGLNAKHVKGDIKDGATLLDLIAETDAVVHLAADTRVLDSIENPVHNFENNVIGSMNILEAMRKCNKKRIAFASTGGAIIGEATPPLHEEQVAKPISPYGSSKLAIEGYLSSYGASYGLQPLSFRFSNVYGPRSFHKGSVVAAFYKAILAKSLITIYGDGEQSRDFIHVKDLTNTIVECLGHDTSGVFQLGSGIETTLNELLQRIEGVVGAAAMPEIVYKPARDGEVYKTYCDISRASKTLGYSPEISLDEGLSKTWEWFLQTSNVEIKQAA